MLVSDIENFPKMKSKFWLSIEKIILKCKTQRLADCFIDSARSLHEIKEFRIFCFYAEI